MKGYRMNIKGFLLHFEELRELICYILRL